MMVDVFWGIKELDTSEYNHWNPEYIGKAIMDTDFNLSPKESQTSILNFCKDLRK